MPISSTFITHQHDVIDREGAEPPKVRIMRVRRTLATFVVSWRMSPLPNLNPARPLIPGTPGPAYLPFNPVTYLPTVIDSIAPLICVRACKGQAGGGASLEVSDPVPHTEDSVLRDSIHGGQETVQGQCPRQVHPHGHPGAQGRGRGPAEAGRTCGMSARAHMCTTPIPSGN